MRQDIWRSVGLSLVLLGLVAQSAGDLARDRTLYERALRDHSPDHSAFLSFLPVLHAKTLRLAGHPGNAWAEVTRSRDGRPFPGHLGAARALEEDVILLALGRAPGANAPLAEAEEHPRGAPNVAWQARLHDLRAARPGPGAEAHRENARALRERHGLPDRHWSAL
ncbi:hypothetical protein DAETH_39600 (plasmid) [Deinococcus aetherius]|uniref:Uncharacterized protein n=1 Tax=Deinococcus aetherius TaxID=200252 RepID=A0ABN6RQF6_9DEIO|nr:hypothetical protein [Deinococcus aetherius]BDP43991.1 hypothetical protein DAETH_39600 [Deinococcus aetherius]